MDSYVKIRCSREQREAWKKAAGLAQVSTWARDVLDREAKRITVKGRKILVDDVQVGELGVLRTPAEAARAAEMLKHDGADLCRHGLVKCRVCGHGV